jgi:arginase
MTKLKAEMIGYDSGWGCRNFECEDGFAALAAYRIMHKLRDLEVEVKWRGALGIKALGDHAILNTKEKTLPLIVEGNRRLANHVQYAIENRSIPIVIGGDHASAIGTWAGAVNALHAHQKFGLIWLDAHLDSHTYETSSQGKWGGWWHGQPVTALMGYGLPDLTRIGGIAPKLSPAHMTIIGIHSFEPAEQDFVKKHGIKTVSLEEVQKRGFDSVLQEALLRATTGTLGFGLSIDLDCFDPMDAPAVGASEDKGMRVKDTLPALKSIARHPQFKALEIAEFNPHKDKNDTTKKLIEDILTTVFAKNTPPL